MLGRDEARGGGARLAGEGASAHLADRVARLAGAAEHARAHHVLVDREPEGLELGGGAIEQALGLLVDRLARLAFEAEIDEALALPVEHSFSHFVLAPD